MPGFVIADHDYACYVCGNTDPRITSAMYMYVCTYIYGEQNIVLVLVPLVDSDK